MDEDRDKNIDQSDAMLHEKNTCERIHSQTSLSIRRSWSPGGDPGDQEDVPEVNGKAQRVLEDDPGVLEGVPEKI